MQKKNNNNLHIYGIHLLNPYKTVVSHLKANSKEIGEEILFPYFFRKMLISAVLLRFKANYLEKMHGYPHFSFWLQIALAKIYFFRMVPIWSQNLRI